ncbi:nitroreductase family protein [Clostridium sp. AM58-1XD]|uniref:nitroreductase family protein n=1 Tax=Clostridium sp. AM58-1XD TaxID=2292307 RepID=UPI00269DA9FB
MLKDEIDRFEKIAVKLFRRLLPLMRLFIPMAKRMTIDDHFFFKKAPAAIMVVSRDEVNGALAAANMELMAEACGLGVLYSGFFSMAVNKCRSLRRKLGLKRGERAVMTLVIGYSNVTYRRTVQKEAATVRQF